jgi:hypothetical protein
MSLHRPPSNNKPLSSLTNLTADALCARAAAKQKAAAATPSRRTESSLQPSQAMSAATHASTRAAPAAPSAPIAQSSKISNGSFSSTPGGASQAPVRLLYSPNDLLALRGSPLVRRGAPVPVGPWSPARVVVSSSTPAEDGGESVKNLSALFDAAQAEPAEDVCAATVARRSKQIELTKQSGDLPVVCGATHARRAAAERPAHAARHAAVLEARVARPGQQVAQRVARAPRRVAGAGRRVRRSDFGEPQQLSAVARVAPMDRRADRPRSRSRAATRQPGCQSRLSGRAK